MTRNINDWYGVTVSHADKIAPRLWVAEATVFRRDTQETIERFRGEGAAMTAADDRADKRAAAHARSLGKPSDWRPPK